MAGHEQEMTGLWTVWTTRRKTRVDHTAHSPYGDCTVGKVVLFSVIKWSCFR